MEYVEGQSLGRRVQEHGPLPIGEATAYMRQAALGLQHAHERGMVHRDVKPDNLMLTPDGTVKVLDFGLAALTAERGPAGQTELGRAAASGKRGTGGLTEENVVIGTPDFMAPEQAADARSADIRADVYSLGCTLYYLLTGRVPYPAPTLVQKLLAHHEQPAPSLRQARPDVPPELDRIVVRMLAKQPGQRYQTPAEVAVALAPFTQPARVRPPRTRRRLLIAVALAALLVGLTWAAVVVYRSRTDRGEPVRTGAEPPAVPAGQVRRIEAHGGAVSAVLWSDDGRRAYSAGDDDLIRVWDTATWEQVGRFEGHNGVVCLALSPDGHTLLSGGLDQTVRVWDTARGKELRRLEGISGGCWCVALSRDGKYALAEGETEQSAHFGVWEVASGKRLRHYTGQTNCLAFLPDGRHFLRGGADGRLRLLETDTGREVRSFEGHTGWIRRVAVSGDGRRALSVSGNSADPDPSPGNDSTVRCWGLEEGVRSCVFRGHRHSVFAGVFVPGQNRVLSGSADKTIRLWDLDSEKEILRWNVEATVECLAASPDGRFALSGRSRQRL